MIAACLFWSSVVFILYTYIGYPLMLPLLARFRPEKLKFPAIEPSVTLLIAAYNEEAVIAKKLENSLALVYPRSKLQILVAADGSDDHTAEIVKSYAAQGIELNHNSLRRGKMAAINRALSQARHEIVLFSDANNMYDPQVVREIVAPFSDPKVGAVSGAKIVLAGESALGQPEGLYWKYESFIKKHESRLGSIMGVSGEILAVRRSYLEPCPENIINDDFYIALRLIQQGYQVVYAPTARSFEPVSLTAKDEITRRARISAGIIQLQAMGREALPNNQPLRLWQFWSHKLGRTLIPIGMIGAFLGNLIAVVSPRRGVKRSLWNLAFPFNWMIFIVQIVFYGLALAGNYREPKTKLGKILYLPTFLVNSNLAALIGLFRFLTRRQSVLWKRVARREDTRQVNV
jgi:poly-beta-1,6-N-acetyl-D-glucosamine synthase